MISRQIEITASTQKNTMKSVNDPRGGVPGRLLRIVGNTNNSALIHTIRFGSSFLPR